MKIKRILLPIAPEQELNERFHLIFDFANQHQCLVTLFSVIDDLTAVRVARYHDLNASEILIEAINHQQDHLNKLINNLTPQYPAIHFSSDVESGIAFQKIIQKSIIGDYELIATDYNRGQKFQMAQFGSTTRHLMRKSALPVWTVAPHEKEKVQKIVAAVDVSNESDVNYGLNNSIIDLAFQYSQSYSADLYIFHAWQLAGEGFFNIFGGQTKDQLAQWALEEQEERKKRIEYLVDNFIIQNKYPKIVMQEGYAQDLIPEFIKKHNIDLLVMGTLSRTGIKGFIIGNTAESMLDAVHCSVITLKPKGFVTPVEI